jgi:hypothetical protein
MAQLGQKCEGKIATNAITTSQKMRLNKKQCKKNTGQ